MKKVTYIGHSGVSVELDRTVLIFDCIAGKEGDDLEFDTGKMPEFPVDKDIYFFASHTHRDHFCPKIFEYGAKYPKVTYILGNDIKTKKARAQEKAVFLKANERASFCMSEGNEMLVETLLSTDEGVAFYVTVEGIEIYHAGDLHAWYWEEEGPVYVRQMKGMFRKELEKLKGRSPEIAFLLLDPRLEEQQYAGADEYLAAMQVKHFFPIHSWKKFDIIRDYKEMRKDVFPQTQVHQINGENQVFDLTE